MKPWKRIEPTTVTKVGWRVVTTKTFELPDGRIDTYDTFHAETQHFANVIALTPDNMVIVARQYRPGPEKIMDELPGGYVDTGEDPEVTVRRELLEETGYEVGQLTYLGTICKDAFFNSTHHTYFAIGCQKKERPVLDHEWEYVEPALMSIGDFLDSARTGGVSDAPAVLLAYDRLTRLNEQAAT